MMPVEGLGNPTAPAPIRLPLERAEKFAQKIVGELQPFCSLDAGGLPAIAVAGSIRRRRPEVADIDIVCLPRDEAHREQIRARALRTQPWILQDGPMTLLVILDTPLGPIQLDLWFASHPDKHMFGETPGNWGSLLLLRTGSRRHNLWMLHQLAKRDLKWHTSTGVFKNGHCLASETEEEFFRILDSPFIAPEDRE